MTDVMFNVSGGQAPITIGLGFRDGEWPSDPQSTSCGQAVTVLARYLSGNPKHAVASGIFEPGPVTLSTERPASAALTLDDIQAARPSATVMLGDELIKLSELLDQPEEVSFSTPTMAEAVFSKCFTNQVRATFQVRLFRDKLTWVRVRVGRDDPKRGSSKDSTGIIDHLMVVVHGQTLHTGLCQPIHKNGGMSFEAYSDGNAYDHEITYNTKRLQETGLVPNMGWLDVVTAARMSSRLNSSNKTYRPGDLGNYKDTMGSGGVTGELGPVTGWAACWLGSNGDPRGWRALIANTLSAAAYPITWRNDQGQILKPSDSPDIAYNGTTGTGTSYLTNGAFQFDGAHNSEIGFLAYLVTGDIYFRDLMLGNVAALYMLSPVAGEGVKKRSVEQIRQIAWLIRAVGNAALILADDHPSLPDMREWLWTQYEAAIKAMETAPDSELGIPWVWGVGQADEPIQQRQWMHNFWAWAIARYARVDALRGPQKGDAQRLARWMLQSIVGQLQDCPDHGAGYNARYSERLTGRTFKIQTADKLYKTWAEFRLANYRKGLVWKVKRDKDKASPTYGEVIPWPEFDAAPEYECQNALQKNGSTSPSSINSHWAQMMPAIAEAFEYGVPGIHKAWGGVRSASNYESDIYKKDWTYGGWGVAAENQPLEPLSVAVPDPKPVDPEPPTPEPVEPPPMIDYKVHAVRNPDGTVSRDWLRTLPLGNTVVQVQGNTGVDMIDLHHAHGFPWRNIILNTSHRLTALYSACCNAWTDFVLTPDGKLLKAAGSGDGYTDNGVSGLDLETLQHTIECMPTNTKVDDDPYKPGAAHTYNQTVVDPRNGDIYRFRGTGHVWRKETNTWERFPLRYTDRKGNVIENYPAYISGWMFWDKYRNRIVGCLMKNYDYSAWNAIDPDTGEMTDLSSDLRADGRTHICQLPNGDLVATTYDAKNDTASISRWDMEGGKWAFRYRAIPNPLDWETNATYATDHNMTLNVHVPEFDGKNLFWLHDGPDKYQWRLRDVETGASEDFPLNGHALPKVKYAAGKCVRYEYAPDLVFLVWYIATDDKKPMVYLMRLAPIGDVVPPPIDPVDPVKPEPVDPEPPLPPVDPDPETDLAELAARLVSAERRIEALEKTKQRLNEALTDAPGSN